MPQYTSPSFQVDIHPTAIFVDTNVIYKAFAPDEQYFEEAREFLFEDPPGLILIPPSVVVETWGLLVGRDRRWDRGIEFIQWLAQPGNEAQLLPDCLSNMSEVLNFAANRVDCVDALLVSLLDHVNGNCRFPPPQHLAVASLDRRDFRSYFGQLRSRGSLKFRVYDIVEKVYY